jgi:hypothetical protein
MSMAKAAEDLDRLRREFLGEHTGVVDLPMARLGSEER